MQTNDRSLSAQSDEQIYLLAGQPGPAGGTFLHWPGPSEQQWRQCADMLEVIKLAAEGNFKTIFVVMASFGPRLESALRTLRRVCNGTEIVLLAQMHQEPAARKLLRSAGAGGNIADDYFICPADIESILGKDRRPCIASAGQIDLLDRSRCCDAKIKRLEKLATEDDLTGLKNRRYVWEFLRQVIKRPKNENLRATLLVFDIDDFKHYNDVYGHPVGDDVLKQAAIMMHKCCREHDVIGRIGGDEFVVIFWDLPDVSEDGAGKTKQTQSERRKTMEEHPREALFMAERFRNTINTAKLHSLGAEGKGALTISGGLASFPYDGETVEELFEQADRAMREAKRSGKNQIYLVGEPGKSR